jgi:hypothetical protein
MAEPAAHPFAVDMPAETTDDPDPPARAVFIVI